MVTGIVLGKIPGVAEIYAVAGEYDLVVIIRVKNNADLAEIIASKMTHDIRGIIHTKTLVTLNSYSKYDLEKIFLS